MRDGLRAQNEPRQDLGTKTSSMTSIVQEQQPMRNKGLCKAIFSNNGQSLYTPFRYSDEEIKYFANPYEQEEDEDEDDYDKIDFPIVSEPPSPVNQTNSAEPTAVGEEIKLSECCSADNDAESREQNEIHYDLLQKHQPDNMKMVLHPHDVLKDHNNNNNLFSTPVKSSRRTNPNPNFTRSDNRKKSPPTGVRRHKSTASVVSDPPMSTAKNLVMGQVKILKRGEPLDESATVLKDNNHRKVSTTTAATTPAVDRKASRKVTPAKKKPEKEKKVSPKPNPNPNNLNSTIDELKLDDFALSSTDRLGPDPEMVPKKSNMAEFFFAGSAFVDSPPPSSVPLPGFFTKSFVKEDASSDLRRMLGLSLA
ncbi:hypothetical protein CTI12_AA095140 [Artemisia annua]|uniref:Uncharacterized protein n=1 Tax=Artemisia annua TaxID=35608 RepID=A0A2U1PYX6_ARTAN|nr:hypothetical protein CTI12_AA095140 [Artemisia annua]